MALAVCIKEQSIPESALFFVGMNEATIRAHTTKKAPKTKGGPGTSCQKKNFRDDTTPRPKTTFTCVYDSKATLSDVCVALVASPSLRST